MKVVQTSKVQSTRALVLSKLVTVSGAITTPTETGVPLILCSRTVQVLVLVPVLVLPVVLWYCTGDAGAATLIVIPNHC
jgi:hypothetical protein